MSNLGYPKNFQKKLELLKYELLNICSKVTSNQRQKLFEKGEVIGTN